MAATVTERDKASTPPGVEAVTKEEEDEFQDLSAVLQHLGLSEYKRTFDEEKIDIESFVRTSFLSKRTITATVCKNS